MHTYHIKAAASNQKQVDKMTKTKIQNEIFRKLWKLWKHRNRLLPALLSGGFNI